MIRIDDERGGDVVFVVNSFLLGIRMGKRSTKGDAPSYFSFHFI